MKRILTVALTIMLLLSFAACGNAEDTSSSENKPSYNTDGSENVADGQEDLPPDKNPATDNYFPHQGGFVKAVAPLTAIPEGYIGIYTFEDLLSIREEEKLDGKYILMNDITCGELPDFASYSYAVRFTGVLDGNGYTIRQISSALFASLHKAEISNLKLELKISYTGNSGMDSRTPFGLASEATQCTLRNCVSTGTISVSNPIQSPSVAGLVGSVSRSTLSDLCNEADISVKEISACSVGGIFASISAQSTIENCYNLGDLTVDCVTADTGYGFTTAIVGGIGASYTSQHSSATYCYNKGNVTISFGEEDSVKAGGIFGYLRSYTGNPLSKCYNIGMICATDAVTENVNEAVSLGGIVGAAGNKCEIREAENRGSIRSSGYAGGIVGAAYQFIIEDALNRGEIDGAFCSGGIIAERLQQSFTENRINNCLIRAVNTGAITQAAYYGGLIGRTDMKITSVDPYCYYLDTCDRAGTFENLNDYSTQNLGIFASKSAEQLKSEEQLAGLNFENTWRLSGKERVLHLSFYLSQSESVQN